MEVLIRTPSEMSTALLRKKVERWWRCALIRGSQIRMTTPANHLGRTPLVQSWWEYGWDYIYPLDARGCNVVWEEPNWVHDGLWRADTECWMRFVRIAAMYQCFVSDSIDPDRWVKPAHAAFVLALRHCIKDFTTSQRAATRHNEMGHLRHRVTSSFARFGPLHAYRSAAGLEPTEKGLDTDRLA